MNSLFDKIYCINLDTRVDRWERCKHFFENNNINVERFSAIRHDNGLYGCALSHTKIIQDAKKNNLKNVLIFEDDFNFLNYDLRLIKEAYADLPEDWDVFYLGFNPTEKLTSYNNNLYKINGAWCLHAYAVNHKFYDYTLNNFIIPFDVLHKNAQPHRKFYGIKKIMCIQRNEFSNIQNRVCDYETEILDNFKKYSEN